MKFNEIFLNDLRKDLFDKLDNVQIKVDSEWKNGIIESKSIKADEICVVASFPQFNESEIYIESSRILDRSGGEVAVQDERYNKLKGHGLLINISIPIKEVIPDVQ